MLPGGSQTPPPPGHTYTTEMFEIALAKFSPMGAPVTSFGTNGIAVFNMESSNTEQGRLLHMLNVDTQGKIYLMTSITDKSYQLPPRVYNYPSFDVIVRLNQNGSLDKTYGRGGAALIKKPSGAGENYQRLNVFKVQDDSRLLMLGDERIKTQTYYDLHYLTLLRTFM